jgi:thiamine pyrophosphokinase
MQAVIFANGVLGDGAVARALALEADLVIAADGGTWHALALDVTPDVVIGDLDSLGSEACDRLEEAGTQLITFPSGKDETDLELALLHAVDAGAEEITVLAALGGRLDQMMANLLLLAMPQLAEVVVQVVDGRQRAFLLRDEVTIRGRAGDTLSLIPLGGDAAGVTTEGLAWTLDDETLRFGFARGVSNVLEASEAHVSLRRGLLLCVLLQQEP